MTTVVDVVAVGEALRVPSAVDLTAIVIGALTGGLLAAELAALPLMDLMSSGFDWDAAVQGGDGWEQLASMSRVEVYQATGMLIGALGVGPTEALLRLRAYAFAHDMTATDTAWAIVEGRLSLDPGDWSAPGRHGEEPG